MHFGIFAGTLSDYQSNCGRLYISKMLQQYFPSTMLPLYCEFESPSIEHLGL